MSSSAAAFDRLTYVDRLKEAGVDDKQARAHAEALDMALRDAVATKSDVEKLEAKLEAKIETTAANLKVDILRWMIVTQLATGGLLFAALRFAR